MFTLLQFNIFLIVNLCFICLPESIKLTSNFFHCSCDSIVTYI